MSVVRESSILCKKLGDCFDSTRTEFAFEKELLRELSRMEEKTLAALWFLLPDDVVLTVVNYLGLESRQLVISFLSGLHSRMSCPFLVNLLVCEALDLICDWLPQGFVYADLPKVPPFQNATSVPRPPCCFAREEELFSHVEDTVRDQLIKLGPGENLLIQNDTELELVSWVSFCRGRFIFFVRWSNHPILNPLPVVHDGL